MDKKKHKKTIRVYCGDTLSYNNGVPSHTEPKSVSVKARQLIYRYSTNTIKLKVKKLDMEYSIINTKFNKSSIKKRRNYKNCIRSTWLMDLLKDLKFVIFLNMFGN